MRYLRRFHPASILLGVVLSLCVVGIATPFAISRAEGGGSSEQAATRAAPLTSSFTFQGQLQQTGTPINVPYDFEFRLYSDAAGTTLVPGTPTVTKNDLAVTNGLFTADLDFGAGAFNGDARWLKVSVREGTSSGVYADLTPLQALTAAPYALYSQKTGPHGHLGETWEDSLGLGACRLCTGWQFGHSAQAVQFPGRWPVRRECHRRRRRWIGKFARQGWGLGA